MAATTPDKQPEIAAAIAALKQIVAAYQAGEIDLSREQLLALRDFAGTLTHAAGAALDKKP